MSETRGELIQDIDLSILTDQQLADYRQELIIAIQHPGIEYETIDAAAEAAYRTRLAGVDAVLRTRTGSPEGGNL